MFLTGLFPFAEYALPAISGILLSSLVIEFNKKTALIAYVAVAILSLFVVPNKEAALIFTCFLGYYPILKSVFEQIKNRFLERALKQILFNLAIILAYLLAIYVFGMSEIINELYSGFKYGALALLLAGNVVFVIYDIALTGIIAYYIQKLRPRFKKLL